jgi:hypothetical protein
MVGLNDSKTSMSLKPKNLKHKILKCKNLISSFYSWRAIETFAHQSAIEIVPHEMLFFFLKFTKC